MSVPTILDAPTHDSTGGRFDTARERRPLRILPATRKVLLAFAVLTLLATNQLLVVASFTDRYFAWTISPTDRGLPRSRLLVELLYRVRGLSRALVG